MSLGLGLGNEFENRPTDRAKHRVMGSSLDRGFRSAGTLEWWRWWCGVDTRLAELRRKRKVQSDVQQHVRRWCTTMQALGRQEMKSEMNCDTETASIASLHLRGELMLSLWITLKR